MVECRHIKICFNGGQYAECLKSVPDCGFFDQFELVRRATLKEIKTAIESTREKLSWLEKIRFLYGLNAALFEIYSAEIDGMTTKELEKYKIK